MAYDNTNTGAAFKVASAHPKAPAFSGPLNVEGKDYEISIWEKTSKAGKPFFSIKLGPPRPKKAFAPSAHNQSKSNGYAPQADEDIPF